MFKYLFILFIVISDKIDSFKRLVFKNGNINTKLFQSKNVDNYLNLGTNPTLAFPNDNGIFTWYPIGFAKDFSSHQKRITIRDINYIVWRENNKYYCLRDSCSHQGSSFLHGKTVNENIVCPYHGYVFNGEDGKLVEIPKMNHINSCRCNVDCFKVVEKGEIVYLNTVSYKNEIEKNLLDESKIFVEPEYDDNNQRVVIIRENFENYAKLVSVNSLDICHIGFVHTFGNKKNPNPNKMSHVIQIGENANHYKIIYQYHAGEHSLVNKIFNFNNITVENEYILPHTTVARVIFGNYSSTIITHALPESRYKTKLFVKAYRNYWSCNVKTDKLNMLYTLDYLINKMGDKVTYNTMVTTLKQDKLIVDNIDKSDYEHMHGKFSILYDLFSNHYKNNYNMIYESDKNKF
jgi:phenylpropionate dioxygenase-like ring-hydroxylating dioxygenase large terminal subunit